MRAFSLPGITCISRVPVVFVPSPSRVSLAVTVGWGLAAFEITSASESCHDQSTGPYEWLNVHVPAVISSNQYSLTFSLSMIYLVPAPWA